MAIKEIKKKQKKVRQAEEKKKSEKNLCPEEEEAEEEGLERVTGKFVEHEIRGPEMISDSGLQSGEAQQIQEPETLEGSLENVPSIEKEQKGIKDEEVEKKLYAEKEQGEEKVGEETRILGVERLETRTPITRQPSELQRRDVGMIRTSETRGFIEEPGAKKYEAGIIKDRDETSKESGATERVRKYESATH